MLQWLDYYVFLATFNMKLDKSATRENGKIQSLQRFRNKLQIARLLLKNPDLIKERINTAEAEKREARKKALAQINSPIVPLDLQGESIPVGGPIEGNSPSFN